MGQNTQPAAAGTTRRGTTRRGPVSRLHQQIDAVEQLPKTKQQFVSQMLETVLAQASH
ncbi:MULTISPECIES: hypothetical protein [Variovorax]|uniref:hypothetical protein n=1 Tax=Variovorax TaxID=34072 RepID=UPI00088CD099|nr:MULTISPECIES: hypothetical protein [Variovorax]MDP9932636.1 peptide deformylase [Variovorax paradoxus]SDJ58998.1 hypothetical protein SAMN05444748_11646 [Variovorax sp. OV700]